MPRVVIADVSGITNITDIADVADIVTDIAGIATDITDIADIVNIRILRWRQVGAYKVLLGCPVIEDKVVPPPPRSGCCYRVNCNRVCCCWPGY